MLAHEARRQHVQPCQQRGQLAAGEHVLHETAKEPHGVRVAARRERVLDRFLSQGMGFEPCAGTTVQHDLLRIGEAFAKEIDEELVVPEPAALVIQPPQEEVGALDLKQHLPAVGALGDSIAEIGRKAIEDAGLAQEVLQRFAVAGA